MTFLIVLILEIFIGSKYSEYFQLIILYGFSIVLKNFEAGGVGFQSFTVNCSRARIVTLVSNCGLW